MTESNNAFPFGYRIVGNTANDRRLVDWSAAFRGCCECDNRAEVERESYLSAFCFGDDFRRHLAATARQELHRRDVVAVVVVRH